MQFYEIEKSQAVTNGTDSLFATTYICIARLYFH